MVLTASSYLIGTWMGSELGSSPVARNQICARTRRHTGIGRNALVTTTELNMARWGEHCGRVAQPVGTMTKTALSTVVQVLILGTRGC